jgi:hypothetical protein
MDPEEEKKRRRGRGPLYRRGPAAGWFGGRTYRRIKWRLVPTVGLPPFKPAIGLLPPLAVAVGSWPAGQVGDLPTAV